MVKLTGQLKVLSLNVRGINDFKKRRCIFNWIRKNEADVIFLQETYSARELENRWKNEWGGRVFFVHGSNHSRGGAILLKNTVNCDVEEHITDNTGRVQILKTKLDDQPLCFVNIYAPNDENSQVAFFQNVKKLIVSNKITDNYEIIIGGDFNTIMDINLDKKGGSPNIKERSKTKILQMMDDFNLIDIWRVKNPTKRRYTWRQQNPLVQCRLDYFLISESLHDNTQNVDILPAFRSDPSGISLLLKGDNEEKRGRGYWKLNTSLLDDNVFCNSLRTELTSWLEQGNHLDSQQKWEWIKYCIRGYSIEYSKDKARKQNDEIKLLQQEVSNLESYLDDDEMKKAEYAEAKRRLEEHMERKTNGTIIRAKIRWYEEGEKSTKYFYNLEKRNQQKKTVKKLIVDGQEIEGNKAILKEAKDFYKNLYESKVNPREAKNLEHIFLNDSLPKISEEDKIKCEGAVTLDECWKALKSFEKNKSPGNDGIPAEFYQKFWPDIKTLMVNSFNASYIKGTLSQSQRQAVITLLEKTGKDRNLLKNWRPISLLNVDYKILSKALANRIIPLLPNIIHHNQTGYVKNRNITDAIRSILDVMDYTDRKQISGILLCLDFEKAFDSIEWNFMTESLKAFNFGASLVQWVKTLYTDVSSCIMNNGFSSGYFNVERGVRQGDPLSPYLFIIALETLSHAIRNDINIEGIKIGKSEEKLGQYADDTNCYLKDRKSVENLFKLLELFRKVSGLKVNKEKTEMMWLGIDKFSKRKLDDLPIPKDIVKILGVHMGYDQKEIIKANLEDKLRSLSQTFHLWRTRNLTIEGRILLAKSIGISKFNHVASVLPIPEDYIRRIEQCLYSFIWKGKPDKVKRKLLIADKHQGGKRMLDLNSIIQKNRIRWIQKYLQNSASTWKLILEEYLKPYGGPNLFLFCNYDIKEFDFLPYFYKSMLQTWGIFCKFFKDPLKNPFIWNNSLLKIGKKTVFIEGFFKAGMWFFEDLYSKDGNPIPFSTWEMRGVDKKYFFTWIAIIKAAKTLKGNRHLNEPENIQKFTWKNKTEDFVKLNPKMFYEFFVQRESVIGPTNKEKVEKDFGEVEWEKVFLLPYEVTIDPKLRELQYKILNNYIATNKLLYKCRIKDTQNCEICLTAVETIQHLFWDCTRVRTLWLQFEIWWNSMMPTGTLYPKLDVKVVLFGLTSSHPFQLLYNHILLIIKKFIFKNKSNEHLTLHQAVQEIHEVRKIEEKIAQKRNREYLFIKKWEIILSKA